MNLIFCNAPTKIIFLTNDRMFGSEYYVKLSSQLNNCSIQHTTLITECIEPDPLNYWNSSFYVNIQNVLDNIQIMSS